MLPIFIKVHDVYKNTLLRINVDDIRFYKKYDDADLEEAKTYMEMTRTSDYFYIKESPKQIDNLIAKAIKETCIVLDD